MKKWLSLLLILALTLSLAPAAFAGDGADAPDGLPAVGETVEGFTVREIRDFPLVGATVVVFEHDRTGAELMYFANSDTNRVFDLTFFTRAIDNTGLPHVFEHSTLDGSQKYPSRSLFFNLSYQTYNTFMNAMTYPLMTTYPVASLSEEQLLKYADYYTDSCLHPTILEDESIFREEAWRYRMEDAEDDLTIEGTVYSEMLGAIDLDSAAYTNMLRAAFPGSTIGNISGGDPGHIPEMTWESLKAYHELYYHPSNCVAFLYGQFDDYTAFLKLLNEAFAPYERQEFTFDDAEYTALKKSVESKIPFPVEEGSSTEHASTIYYSFLCPGLNKDPEEEMVMNTLTDLLGADASPLMLNLKKALPSGTFGSYIEMDGPEDAIVFYAANVDPGDAAAFKATVNKVLSDVGKKGFSKELTDGVMAALSLAIKLTGEGDDVGVDLISSIAASYAASGDMYNYMDYVDALGRLVAWNDQGLYKNAVSKWLLKKPVTVLVTTYPQAGLREELDAAETERLAELKAGMTAEEIAAIVAASNAPEEEDDASRYVARLQAVTVSSLPEEQRSYKVTDTVGEDGVRRLTAPAEVDGVGQVLLLLDAQGLPLEDIHWFALYTAVVGGMQTSAHTRDELAELTTRYLYSGQIRLSLLNSYGSDEYHPYLRASWIAADEDLAAGYDLLYEILFDSQFDDAETLLGLIQKTKASLKSSINSTPYSPMLYRSLGASVPLYAYYSWFNHMAFYAFLEQAEADMETDPEGVAENLRRIQQYFRNRTNAIAAYAGSAEGIEVNAPLTDAFMARLDDTEIKAQTYDFTAPARSEALVIDSSVQFNGIAANYAVMGLKEYTADMDAVSALVSDLYLYPMLRDQYGVYGALHGFVNDAGSYVISYRDPNVKETFEVYEGIPEFLRNLELDQETLDGYILSSYSSYAMPEGELSGALSALVSRLCGEPENLKIQYMRQLKAVTPDKVRGYADAYERLLSAGQRFTAGSASAAAAYADLYDAVLNPFGAVDAGEVEFTDVPESHEHYEAVRYVFEEYLMDPLGEDFFGVDEEAAAGDLALALYSLIDDEAAEAQDVLDLFASYGIVPASWKAEDTLTGADAQRFLADFSQAVEVEYTADDAEDKPITRGELAELIKAYVEYLESLE